MTRSRAVARTFAGRAALVLLAACGRSTGTASGGGTPAPIADDATTATTAAADATDAPDATASVVDARPPIVDAATIDPRRSVITDQPTSHEPGLRPLDVPKTSISTPIIDGALELRIVLRTLQQHRRQIGNCYEQALAAAPALAGRLVTHFRVEADGHVTGATATGVTDDVAACAIRVLGAIVFPLRTHDVSGQVNVAFTFAPTGG